MTQIPCSTASSNTVLFPALTLQILGLVLPKTGLLVANRLLTTFMSAKADCHYSHRCTAAGDSVLTAITEQSARFQLHSPGTYQEGRDPITQSICYCFHSALQEKALEKLL